MIGSCLALFVYYIWFTLSDMKQGNKTRDIIFIVLFMTLLLIPSAGMIFCPTTVSYENRELKEYPGIFGTDGRLNETYFDAVSDYVSDHIALRNETAGLYTVLNAGLFSVSARENVILGEDDWLYYTATTDDFLHRNPISGRKLYIIAHNMYLIQEYCETLGKKAVFAIAPNKNSLYGEYMPQVYKDARAAFETKYSDMDRLMPYLESESINHTDLKKLFEAQDEILYYKKDSHWNNKGALLVYNELMEKAGAEALLFDDDSPETTVDFVGDLNKMLYGPAARPEEKLEYIKDRDYFYLADGEVKDIADMEMVENNEVETVNPQGDGTILMYRDSYANSLIPYLSQTFSYAYYSKIVPYNMTDIAIRNPDYVLIEKAERHLPTFAEVPPIMSAPLRQIEVRPQETKFLKGTLNTGNDGVFFNVSGQIDDTDLTVENSRIYISIGKWTGQAYEAFLTGIQEEEYGFTCYIPASVIQSEDQEISVILESEGKYFAEEQKKTF